VNAHVDLADYNVWQAKLRGENPQIEVGVAYAGIWRRRWHGEKVPVYVWRTDDGMVASTDGGDPVPANEDWCFDVFAWCLTDPVTQADVDEYLARRQTHGKGWWFDEPPVLRLDPVPADPFEALTREFDAELDALTDRLFDGPIRGERGEQLAVNWQRRVTQLCRRIEAARKAAVAGLSRAEAKPINEPWKALAERAKRLKVMIARILKTRG